VRKPKTAAAELLNSVREGNKRRASELMTLIEEGSPEGEEYLKELAATPKRAYVLGVTGWPGVGKSSLVYRIARSLLGQNKAVGIIAIDPSSPLSGGSLLGDRERMKGIDGDERLFIRSAATRGHPGGIAKATRGFVKVMEAMGKEIVIVETVGVGQDQVSIVQMAHTVLLVVVPGLGDYLQSLKAGVLEIGDIFVVNKSDRQGADQTVADIEMMLGMNGSDGVWKPPVIKTVATNGAGTDELMRQIERHRQVLEESQSINYRRRSAAKTEILELISARCLQRIAERLNLEELLETYAERTCEGFSDPYTAVDEILRQSGIL